MSLDAHIVELSDKHRELDRRIEKEETQPGSDELTIHELKKQKLQLKDKMEKLRSTVSAAE